MKALTLALAGNQNCGKTTLFNRLTGENQHVGNWPGVTVERREGTLLGYRDAVLIDLPGLYSLSPFSLEERVSRDFLLRASPDAIINIVDATQPERGLYLTHQLLTLERPVVVALNMMDEARRNGDEWDIPRLSKRLGVLVLPLCARRGEGVDALTQNAVEAAQKGTVSPPMPESMAVGRAETALLRLTENAARREQVPPRYAAMKLLEGDNPLATLTAGETARVEDILRRMEKETDMERMAAVAEARFARIEEIVRDCVRRGKKTDEVTLTERLDRVLTHRLLAMPLFALLMLGVFYLTFGPVGGTLAAAFGALIERGTAALTLALARAPISGWARSLISDGVLRGVGSVLSFLPTILLLFFLLSILEDSGYMARAAFLMDKPLRRLGLNGRAFIPLVMGFGCTVPAVMSARTLGSARDRRFAILLTPLMSCGAKTTIYAMFAQTFFPRGQTALIAGMYLLGVIVATLAAGWMKKHVFHGDAAPFLMELPPYRLPTPSGVLRQMRDKAADFVQRAFTVILLSSVAVWFLQRFTPSLAPAGTVGESILGGLGRWLAPIFRPAGFGSMEATTSLLTGLMAKESVVGTLGVLCGAQGLRAAFPGGLEAISFLVFVLLYPPCVAALAAMRRELGSGKWAAAAALGQTALAWGAATLIYQIGKLLGVGG